MFSCMLGMKESLDQLLDYIPSQNHIKSFAYNLLHIKHTCRYLLFWSLSDQPEFPKDCANRLRFTAKPHRLQTILVTADFNFELFLNELHDKYGSGELNNYSPALLLLTHNKWSRKYRRSPSTAPLLENPIKIAIDLDKTNNLVSFYLVGEVGEDWEIFLGFINHLRRDFKL